MRRILYILAAAAIVAGCFTACKDEGKGKLLDPNAKISIRPAKTAQGVAAKAASYLDPVEIVRQTSDLAMHSPDYPNEPYVNVGISEEQKEYTSPKIMMWGDWIIQNGILQTAFIEAYDVVFVSRDWDDPKIPIKDTLAYIPNAKLRAAEKAIKSAYALEDYELVYKLFDEAYQFTPINGEDWRALVEK